MGSDSTEQAVVTEATIERGSSRPVDPRLSGTSTSSGLGRAAAAVSVVAVVGLVVVLAWSLRDVTGQPAVGIEITRQEVVSSGPDCVWQIDADVANGEELDLTIFTAELNGVYRSGSSVMTLVGGGTTESFTYELPLESCDTDPADLDPRALTIAYRFAGSSDSKHIGAHPLGD